MDAHKRKKNIFKQASTTYYYSSLFFEPEVQKDVYTLYAYVRIADDLIDAIPQKVEEFHEFTWQTKEALKGKTTHNVIVDDFAELSKRRGFKKAWTTAFLSAMEKDITKTEYKTFKELEKYMYGSAEVIGLYMSKIFALPPEALEYAKLQGKAMQLINFIRDIDEDISLGRQYLPTQDLEKFNVHLPPKKGQRRAFKKFMHFQIERYERIQKEAEKGYAFIPKNYLIMVKTSADMYTWTAQKIKKDPLIVMRKKVKPSKLRVIFTAVKHWITL